MDGDAVKSWGLWIDGVEVQSPEAALNTDGVLSKVVLPLVGVGIFVLFLLNARSIRKERAILKERNAMANPGLYRELDADQLKRKRKWRTRFVLCLFAGVILLVLFSR
jgi:hypothetical protein